MNRDIGFPTMWYVPPAKPQISLCICSLIRAFASRLNILSVQLLTEHHLEFLSLKGGCTGSSESTLVKIPHCWKSHVTAHITKLEIVSVCIFFMESLCISAV